MIKILVLIDSSTEFSRRFLSGLIRYANENGSWSFYRLPVYYKTLYGAQGVLDRINDWAIDAVIAQWEYEEVDFLEKLNIPIFIQSYKEDNRKFSKISGDFTGVGTLAANFFAERRFKNFAFYGNKDFFWSKERAEGYRRQVEKLGGNYYYFETESLNDEKWGKNHIELNEWLLSLPKPIALFACDDSFALQISEMCNMDNISIPDELSLLGVDNDELICKLSYPSISSIVTDDEKGGYMTGAMLHKSIIDKSNLPFNIIVKPVRIALRKSTESFVILNKHVRIVVEYIEKNYITFKSINELVDLVSISRRILEIKFREEMGLPIYQYVIRRRVEQVAHLLITTDKKLFDIVLESGYNDCKNISRIFRNYKNCTPYEYRQQYSLLKK